MLFEYVQHFVNPGFIFKSSINKGAVASQLSRGRSQGASDEFLNKSEVSIESETRKLPPASATRS